jgi:hypothetical protein
MTTTRLRQYAVAAAAGLALAACADAPLTAPLAPSDAPAYSAAAAPDTSYSTFQYDPATNFELPFGAGHKLFVPAGSVCDPATSGYGPSFWDAPCSATRAPITFQVKSWRDAAGHPRMVVLPDVRFVPGSTVTLRFRDDAAAGQQRGAIVWCPTGAASCVDEAASDPTLTTRYNPNSGWVYRRLKHFSGYNVVVDRDGSGGGDTGLDAGF